ncbi:MAG: hypothetical protein IJP29_07615 [Lachnospiraceae bacterium]|nr:hypothetical protein [Lachnospiraceae bacterium]
MKGIFKENKIRIRVNQLFGWGVTGFVVVMLGVFLVAGTTYASWVEEENGIKYLQEDGQYAVGFEDIEEKRYYFDSEGHLVTGKFYVEKEGAYYYSDETGALQYGVIQTEEYFFITDEMGRIRTGFVEHDGARYYFNGIGEVVTGWFQYEDDWYYADYTGVVQTGFVTVDGYRYYLNEMGKRVEDTVLELEGVTYIFNSDGSVDENATMLYPVIVYLNEIRSENGLSELSWHSELTTCAILRSAQFVDGFLVEMPIEDILINRGVICKRGYELAYGGTEDYNIDMLLQHMKQDTNLRGILSNAEISDVGLGIYEKDNIYYYSIIFAEEIAEK